MKFTVRQAEKRDIPRLVAMLEQTALVHHNARPDIFKANGKKYNEENLISLLNDNNTLVFVAADNDNLAVGYIICFLQNITAHSVLHDNKTLFIDDLCTDESVRGEGIGKSLYDFAVDIARTLGCYNVTLNVWAKNDGARHFYEKLGLHEQKITLEQIL